MTENDSNCSPYKKMMQEADALLRNAGCDIWGNPLQDNKYMQNGFERRMPKNGFRGASRHN